MSSAQQAKEWPVEIQIRTKSGHTLEKTVQYASGSKANPMSEQEHRENWVGCLLHFARSSSAADKDVERAANELYDRGLRIDSYACFGDWLSEVSNLLK